MFREIWHKIQLWVGSLIFFGMIFLMLINMFIRFTSSSYIVSSEESPKADVAIILGASVYNNGMLSRALEDRTLGALSLYEQDRVKKILVSADSVQTGRKEVNAVVAYLLTKGMNSEDIITDEGGIDTYHSMYRARNVYDVNSALIVTQKFHIARSLYIARQLGIQAYGIPTDSSYSDFKNSFREFFAVIKAFYEVSRHIVPKYATLEA